MFATAAPGRWDSGPPGVASARTRRQTSPGWRSTSEIAISPPKPHPSTVGCDNPSDQINPAVRSARAGTVSPCAFGAE